VVVRRGDSTAGSSSRSGLASPVTAAALGGVALLLLCAATALDAFYPGTLSVGGTSAASDATGVVLVVAFASVGLVVARRQPRNPIGWLVLGASISWELGNYAPAYLDYDYLDHHGSLPLGHVALLFSGSFFYGLLIVPLVVLLFPDGRLGRRWRWPLRAYALVCLLDVVATVSVVIADFRLRTPVSRDGSVIGADHPRGGEAWANSAEALAVVAVFALAFAAIVHQARRYRRATGPRRQQIKWLASGAAICAVILPTFLWSSAPGVVNDLLPLGLAAVPVAIGTAILRHRLYDIDRLISRTLSYALLTALLAGVFIGLVALTTDTLALSGRVGVAASTLAAIALFNPLRVRIQRLVDRHFNRARYDAEAIVAAFTVRLRDAVEIDGIRTDLLDTVTRAVQPSHASVWIKP
jgi:N-terminal 7TM region of histidine kinase